MRMKTINSLMVLLIASMLIIPTAKADVENGWYITGISYDKPFTAQSETVFYVGVVEAKTKTGQMGALDSASPVTDAAVSAVFTKNQEKIVVPLSHDKNGEYKGMVLLTDSGEWSVTVEAAGSHHKTEFALPVKVQESESNGTLLLTFILGFATLAVVIFILKFRRIA